jgi:hypothetical protein
MMGSNSSKHYFLGINKDALHRDLKEGEYTDALNAIYPNNGSSVEPRRESALGNTALTITLPAGTNKCIGAEWDKINNDIIFFNHNSNGNHGMYSIDLSDNSVSLVQALDGLDEELLRVNSIAFLDQFIFWTDGSNVPFYLSRARAAEGLYTLAERSLLLSLRKPTPTSKIKISSISTENITPPSKISNSIFYFAYRYIYFDNERSVLSPYSSAIIGLDKYKSAPAPEDTLNFSLTTPSFLADYIKEIELLVKKPNGNFEIFDTVPTSTTSFQFQGYEVVKQLSDTEQQLLTYDVPKVSEALSVLKNILLIDYHKTNYDDFGSAVLSLDSLNLINTNSIGYPVGILPDKTTFLSPSNNNLIWKPKSKRSVGIVYFDKYFQPSAVKKVFSFEVPDASYGISSLGDPANLLYDLLITGYVNRATITITGNGPSWAKYYQLYLSDDLVFSEYTTCLANLFFYIKDGDTAAAKQTVVRDRIYSSDYPDGATGFYYNNIDLQIPENLGITVDTDCFVRFLEIDGTGVGVPSNYFPVLEVIGDFIRIEAFGGDTWTDETLVVAIEIVRFKDNDSGLFHAKSDVLSIASGVHSSTSVTIFGDASLYNQNNGIVDNNRYYYLDASHTAYKAATGFAITRQATGHSITKALYEKPFKLSSEYYDFVLANTGGSGNNKSSIPDYEILREDKGWPNTENENEREDEQISTLAYSSPYVQNSFINQINQFLPQNKESLAISRGRIRSIVAVDEDVALVIHERTCTSAYIQEGFVRFADGAGALARTDKVIAQERKSRSNYGTINPESIGVMQGKVEGEAGTSTKVYWWDQNEGAACRYSLNGIIPVSDYGMKQYFQQKAQLLKTLTSPEVIGGVHPYWKCYLITFPEINEDNPAETWVFSEEQNRWIGRLSFIPECYASSGTDLFTFKNGIPYIHNSSTYCNYYGVQYGFELEFVCNSEEQLEKVWEFLIAQMNTGQINVTITNSRGQETTIESGEWRQRENKYYADIRRDINTNPDSFRVLGNCKTARKKHEERYR